MREIIILTQYFYPEVASTAQLLTELATDLKSSGFDVTVYTGQPSYQKKEKQPSSENYKGVKIFRLFNTRLSKDSKKGKVINSSTFFLSTLFYLLFSRNRAPLLIVSNPPFLPLLGWFLKKAKGQKYVFLVHDIYPDLAVKLGYLSEKGLITRIWNKINDLIYSDADVIVCLGERMEKRIQEKFADDMDISKIKVIHNWANGDFIVPRRKEDNWFCKEHDLIDKMVILYSGNIGLAHDFETIIEAADRLKEFEDIKFLFIGAGGKKEKLENMVRERNLENVKFLPYQPTENLPFSLTSGDISLITLEEGVEGLCVPSKLYTSLASGLAILALVGENSEIADIIVKFDCGFRIDQRDVDGVVEVLMKLYENQDLLKKMGENARKCFEENFPREKAVREYYEILSNI